jgi:hypothetical protein
MNDVACRRANLHRGRTYKGLTDAKRSIRFRLLDEKLCPSFGVENILLYIPLWGLKMRLMTCISPEPWAVSACYFAQSFCILKDNIYKKNDEN